MCSYAFPSIFHEFWLHICLMSLLLLKFINWNTCFLIAECVFKIVLLWLYDHISSQLYTKILNACGNCVKQKSNGNISHLEGTCTLQLVQYFAFVISSFGASKPACRRPYVKGCACRSIFPDRSPLFASSNTRKWLAVYWLQLCRSCWIQKCGWTHLNGGASLAIEEIREAKWFHWATWLRWELQKSFLPLLCHSCCEIELSAATRPLICPG